ncbi:MAG TPA: HAD hydrolase family protein [Candidatus Cloacimonadota bacterium]|mgnify:CR=1 FL=1|nr:HAD hydrolase family protein [Candidatus Cloacimonadota bacterium]HPT72817.1 HAD hydrolase family protein [Candidatus Cloacimonadota bacterium]
MSFIHYDNIRIVALDCDGVMTDGKITLDQDMTESKQFSTLDGLGFALLHAANIIPVVISGRNSLALERRCEELKIPYLFQGVKNKKRQLESLLKDLHMKMKNVAYMGDDWNDLPVIQVVEFSACPSNAIEPIKQIVNFVSTRRGGDGAVRELIEHILTQKGLYEIALKNYLADLQSS